jgi:hypothetical protein
LTYDVHRSTQENFVPSESNRIISVSGTSYTDLSIRSDTRYFYIVRSRDVSGNRDANLVRRGGVSLGALEPGTYEDDAGDTSARKWSRELTPGNTWGVRAAGTGNTTRHYASTESGLPGNQNCMALVSDQIALGANPALTFRSRFVIEQGWDGGIVEVATEAGGFTNWTKLGTVDYPGLMAGVSEACPGNPGLADGQAVFNGASADWETFGGSLSSFANQTVKLRFLFGTDDATTEEGWFIDDLEITDARVPSGCLPEVSPRGAPQPLRVATRPDGMLDLVFEDLGALATAYNVYEGEIGDWYSHASEVCHATSTLAGVPGPGARTLPAYPAQPGNRYLLVNAVTAADEGVLGFDSAGTEQPLPMPGCGPMP